MIRFVEWLLGRHPDDTPPEVDTADLDAKLSEATAQRAEARTYRRRAEAVGPDIRKALEHDRFGERMAAALEPRGWNPR
jgi:hypothetical protein